MPGLDTNSSNDLRISSNEWGPDHQRISDLYKTIEGSRYRSIEPELHFNCVEQVRKWLDKQEAVIGAVMNIADETILKKLAAKKICQVAVNYSNWMFDSSHKTYETCAKYYDKIEEKRRKAYRRRRLGRIGGVSVFYHDPKIGKNR